MREILFRGKRLDNGEWVEGYISEHTLIPCVMQSYIGWVIECKPTKLYECDWFEVDPNTVGQYTGLTDKNGKRIFEGDIFEDRSDDMYAVVVFKDGCFRLEWHGITGAWMEYGFDECGGGWGIVECESLDMYYVRNFEIIGNIHDNPELMGGGE